MKRRFLWVLWGKPSGKPSESAQRAARSLTNWVWSIVGLQWIAAMVLFILILRRMVQIRRESEDHKID